jgi:FkbM family methyltransferase
VVPLKYQITYSQNREDLILAGLLREVSVGFYVDVGANHPESHSVTKLFYDKGWSGINIEPNKRLHAELEAQRPRDVNICAGISSQPGSLTFRHFLAEGLSTFSSELKDIYQLAGWSGQDSMVEVVTLAQVMDRHRPAGEIHFLKIDAEGMELEVLLGNNWDRYRPWVVCIERPFSHARREAVDAFLIACGYEKIFCDGINDYHVAKEHRDVSDTFSYGLHVLFQGDAVPGSYASQNPAAIVTRETGPVRVMKRVSELLALDGDAFVRAAYQTLLRRDPDPDGLRNYIQELHSGVSKLSVLAKLRNSEEGRRHQAALPGYHSARILQWLHL